MIDLSIAYIDPGSGSLIIQVLIATAVAIPIFFREQIARAARLVRRRGDDTAPGETSPETTDTIRDGA